MAMSVAVKTPGANLGKTRAKTGLKNLNRANQTGSTAPKSNGSLK